MAGPKSVEDYIADLPDVQRAAFEKLRATIRSAAPDATEQISYQMPAFKDANGRFLVSYAAFRDHCSLFPASEAIRKHLAKEIEPYLSGKGTLRFDPAKPIPASLVKKIVKTRLEENEELRRR